MLRANILKLQTKKELGKAFLMGFVVLKRKRVVFLKIYRIHFTLHFTSRTFESSQRVTHTKHLFSRWFAPGNLGMCSSQEFFM